MKKINVLIIVIIVALIAGLLGYNVAKNNVAKKYEEDKLYLQELNRGDLEKLVLVDGPIYVIGHKSPDSDTVCSAIAYANLLNKLGIEAKAVISDKVNNESAYILKEAGIEMPEILYDASGLNIMMVDHSEYAQAIDGMKDANVVGVIDHHGVGTIEVGHQVLYNAKPIGATATIIWMNYLNYGVEMDKNIAHMLLGAVLSDTDNLSSSTTCENDKKAVEALSKLSGVSDIETLYNNLHEQKISYEGFSEEEIIFSDYKEYEIEGFRYGIGQANALNEEKAEELVEKLAPFMIKTMESKDINLMYMSVRADNVKCDYIIPADAYSESILKNAFPNYDEFNGTAYIYKSGLGRKSKLVPGLNAYLTSYPQE